MDSSSYSSTGCGWKDQAAYLPYEPTYEFQNYILILSQIDIQGNLTIMVSKFTLTGVGVKQQYHTLGNKLRSANTLFESYCNYYY